MVRLCGDQEMILESIIRSHTKVSSLFRCNEDKLPPLYPVVFSIPAILHFCFRWANNNLYRRLLKWSIDGGCWHFQVITILCYCFPTINTDTYRIELPGFKNQTGLQEASSRSYQNIRFFIECYQFWVHKRLSTGIIFQASISLGIWINANYVVMIRVV